MQSNVCIQDDYYGYVTKDGVFIPMGYAAYLIEIQLNIETCDILLTLETMYLGATTYVTIPRSDLSSRYRITSYSNKGLDVTDQSAGCFIESIKQQERRFDPNKIFYVHTGLGWVQNDSIIFKRACMPYENNTSYYQGNLSIAPTGSYKEWKKMIEDYVVPSAPLTFVLSSALSAVLNGLSSKFCDGESLLIHLVGGSSTGKTTAAMLAISAAGEPTLSGNSLMRSWSSTRNAIIATLSGNYGYPVVFDELSLLRGDDFSQLVYNITAGTDKTRMTKELTLAEQKGYRTTILSTGEKSILANCNGNGGISVRVIEVSNIVFTESAEAAETIKDICRKNFGWAIDKIAKKLTLFLKKENAMDTLFKRFEFYRKKFLKKCIAKNEFTERKSKKYAIILLSSYLAKKLLNINFHEDMLLDFVVNLDKENSLTHSQNMADEFMEKLSEFIISNEQYFITESNQSIPNCIGKIERSRDNKISKISIIQNKFESIVRDFKFEDAGIVISKLKAQGYLSCDSDRNTRKVKISGQSVRCYVIKFSVWSGSNEHLADENGFDDGYHDYDNL